MSDDKKLCDICGYDHMQSVISEYPDGVFRCRICSDKAAHGRFVPDREIRDMSYRNVKKLNEEFKQWLRSL